MRNGMNLLSANFIMMSEIAWTSWLDTRRRKLRRVVMKTEHGSGRVEYRGSSESGICGPLRSLNVDSRDVRYTILANVKPASRHSSTSHYDITLPLAHRSFPLRKIKWILQMMKYLSSNESAKGSFSKGEIDWDFYILILGQSVKSLKI